MCVCVRACVCVCNDIHEQVTSGLCQSMPSVQLSEQGVTTREVVA